MKLSVAYHILPLLLLLPFPSLLGQPETIEEDEGITGFGLALRKLGTVGSVLYVTAHPDDENNALLAKLSRGQGLRTGLLTLTRGDGGQNEIGPELFEALGVLRTQELITVHRYDRARQFFTRAFEFGYSFSVEETLDKWGEEEILRDIVRVIRSFRPQVLISLNPEGTGGGQHHQASAQLAAKAFRLAADPSRYPKQLKAGLRPWQSLRLFQTSLPVRRPLKTPADMATAQVDLGSYDPLLGESYAQFGARARASHRCQGMNVLPDPLAYAAVLRLADQAPESEVSGKRLFEDMDLSIRSISSHDSTLGNGLNRLERLVRQSQEAYQRSDWSAARRSLSQGLDLVRKLGDATESPEARFLLRKEESDFVLALEKGYFLYFDAILAGKRDGILVPGEEFEVESRLRRPDESSLKIESLSLVQDSRIVGIASEFEEPSGQSRSVRFKTEVPEKSEPTQPYWYRGDPAVDRFSVRSGFHGIEAVSPPFLRARLELRSHGVPWSLERPVQYRWFDATVGRARRSEIQVAPRLSVSLHSPTRVLALEGNRRKDFRVIVRNNRPDSVQARVYLELPSGWKSEPPFHEMDFGRENESIPAVFTVRAPEALGSGEYLVRARVESEGQEYDQGFQIIDYHHIQTRHLYQTSESVVRAFPLKIPQLRVGYVTGVGDEVGRVTEELGLEVTYFDREFLEGGDLSAFDVIVTGVRAYLNRDDLKTFNHRLLRYVHEGGHLLVQYNKYEFNQAQFAPYPSRIHRPHDRVTAEGSPVRVLVPEHAVFHSPNKLTEEDWDGWVQERGLYFWGEWDPNYQPLLELQDPWPYNNEAKTGSLLIARHGKGTYVYTGLSLFRQLPAGIPGALRLWVNLLSLGRAQSDQ